MINAEKDHYDKLLKENSCNLKKSWRILKEVINKRKHSSSCSRFTVNNRVTTDKSVIADGFNSFFVNIGPNLANNIPSVNKSPTSFMKNCFVESMVVNEVVAEEIHEIIKKHEGL